MLIGMNALFKAFGLCVVAIMKKCPVLTGSPGHIDDIFPYFMLHAKQIFPMLDCMDDLRKISDLRVPANWYVHQLSSQTLWCAKQPFIEIRNALIYYYLSGKCLFGYTKTIPTRYHFWDGVMCCFSNK